MWPRFTKSCSKREAMLMREIETETPHACRVVILQPAAELGGAERSLLTLLQERSAVQLDASVILPRSGPLGVALSSLGVRWEVVDQPRALLRQSRGPRPGTLVCAAILPFQLPAYLRRLATALRAQAPDVLYSNGIKTHVLSAIVAPWLRVPLVWHVRDFCRGPILARLADRVPSGIIANSHAVAADLTRRMRHPEKVSVVHNAVDLTIFSPDGPCSAVALQRPAIFRVGLPAVLARWKGHLLLLDVVQQICARVPGTIFFIIGGAIYDTVREHGYEQELRREIVRRGLEESVIVTGFQNDMVPWYRAMDVVVHTSTKPEPFGRTVLEAMACGRPVVAADAGGIPEFVTHGENGLLYPMGDKGALAARVMALLADSTLRCRLGAAARQQVERSFSAKRHASQIAAVLRTAVRSSCRVGVPR